MESPICRIDVEVVSFYHMRLLHSLDKQRCLTMLSSMDEDTNIPLMFIEQSQWCRGAIYKPVRPR